MILTDVIIKTLLSRVLSYQATDVDVRIELPLSSGKDEFAVIYFKADNMSLRVEKGDAYGN